MAIWEYANTLRKWLNWIAPICSILFSILYNLVIYPHMFGTFIPFATDDFLFWFLLLFDRPLFLFYLLGVPQWNVDAWMIGGLVAGILSGALYFVFVFKSVLRQDEGLYVFPDHIFMWVTMILAWYGSVIGGILMSFQWLFVEILGDDPFWTSAKARY